MFIYENWLRMTQEWSRIFLEAISVLQNPSRDHCWTQNKIFHFFKTFNFQFSSKNHFLSHKVQDPSCRICSYGPHEAFGFSVKFNFDMGNPYQKTCLGKVTFWDYQANRLIHWYILKSSPMVWSSLRGFCYQKANISEILRHVNFSKISISFYFPDDVDDDDAPTTLQSGQTPIP